MERVSKTIDGCTAAAEVAYFFTEVAPIYPITPSTTMAELIDQWATAGKLNLFGNPVKVVQMQSEAGAAGMLHGSLVSGALSSTFTASQGLLLMIPNMFKIAGELLPAVFYVSARTVATHALSIFGDHSDIYACRQTGCAFLAEGSVQEVADLSVVAHLAAIEGSLPFVNFFDGFNTSHEVEKIKMWQPDDLKTLVNHKAIEKFRKRALSPLHPSARGIAQNPDTFFQAREACNTYYNALPEIVQSYMNKINLAIGTNYSLFNYYGAKDATHIVVAMGSACNTIEETIDYLNAKGKKCGLIKVRLFRPFSVPHFVSALPKTTQTITVLDRTKEPGAVADPLFLDVAGALQGTEFGNVKMFGGRYGLSSKDTRPEQIISVFENAENNRKKFFTIGIIDDVTNLSLPAPQTAFLPANQTTCCKFWGFGSDGTVGAAKSIAKIIGGKTENFVRASFSYDSKKSGGVTVSHLRFSKTPIKSAFAIKSADFVSCSRVSYLKKYKVVQELKPGGTLLLNCSEELLEDLLPTSAKRFIAQNQIKLFAVNASQIADDFEIFGRLGTIMQAAFFKAAQIMPIAEAAHAIKEAAQKLFAKKGPDIVQKNLAAIDAGLAEIKQVCTPKSWEDLPEEATNPVGSNPGYLNDIIKPINQLEGDTLPVSAFLPFADGMMPTGTTRFEKRGVASAVPHWKSENCISCNLCSLVCPHAAIRPVVLAPQDEKNMPEGMQTIPLPGTEYKFSVVVSVLDCMGCGSCMDVCPGKAGAKALSFEPIQNALSKQKHFDFGITVAPKPEVLAKFPATNARNSQFNPPLLEFSGACAGCGETPYAKLVTQLFGPRLIIANATGCSSIWGGSSPTVPYTKNQNGHGPAWANSLFEDNAEFGLGIYTAKNEKHQSLILKLKGMAATHKAQSALIEEFVKTQSITAKAALLGSLNPNHCSNCKDIFEGQEYLINPSVWLFGGDGWAYDIGFGGLDHVMSLDANVNALVMDTEVYSNTGGQSSKATALGAVAKFAAGGKKSAKKNLAEMMMGYGHVYVAQIAMGADYNQAVKALLEAESYNGPSLVVAYAPCINHGIKTGMGSTQTEAKLAVAAGYWNLFRFDPRRKAEGKNPFILDSKEPSLPLCDFLSNEIRYNLVGEGLLQTLKQNLHEHYQKLKQLAEQ